MLGFVNGLLAHIAELRPPCKSDRPSRGSPCGPFYVDIRVTRW
jgi:hypothetical protein